MMNNHTLLKITKIEKNKIKTHCIGVRDVCVTGGGGRGSQGVNLRMNHNDQTSVKRKRHTSKKAMHKNRPDQISHCKGSESIQPLLSHLCKHHINHCGGKSRDASQVKPIECVLLHARDGGCENSEKSDIHSCNVRPSSQWRRVPVQLRALHTVRQSLTLPGRLQCCCTYT